jgi:very-short-patch-repair endonuclease
MTRQTQQQLEALGRRQHEVVERGQLLALGFTRDAIRHQLRTGRLHVVHRGVYAVGRRELTRRGDFFAAVLRCGPTGALMCESAAALWQVRRDRPALPIEVSVAGPARSAPGIVVRRQRHRRLARRHGIPVTSLVTTFIDLAPRIPADDLEAAISEADIRGLIDPERLRLALDREPPRPGTATLRALLDRRTFRVTRSQLERRFLRICRKLELPTPLSRVVVNGFEVDFYWPDLRLIVETDGLTYHRTPAQQARDAARNLAHAAAGITPLRFTHFQVVHEVESVESGLLAVVRRLRSSLPAHGAAGLGRR